MIVKLQLFLTRKGVKAKDSRLLLEAFRRQMMFSRGKKLKDCWLGLGTPSHYKSEYFKPLGIETPRINNWYLLSDKGLAIMELMVKQFPVKRQKTKEKLNEQLFGR